MPIITRAGTPAYIARFRTIRLIPYPKTSASESILTLFNKDKELSIGVSNFD